MLGWMLVFMMMSVTSLVAGKAYGVAYTPATILAGLVFGGLLLVLALTRLLRRGV